MVNAVVGITLWTADLDAMFRFYNDVMRLPLHSKHDDFIAFELGDIRFNIGLHDLVHGPSADPYRVMPHLGVADIHGECQRLASQGVEFIRPPGARALGRLDRHLERPRWQYSAIVATALLQLP